MRSEAGTAPAAPARSVRFLVAQGSLLAFVAGYIDVVGFSALFGLFTAHVTGNFVMIGVELAQSGQGLLAKLLALPIRSADAPATILVGLIGVAAMGVQNAKARIVLSEHAPTTIMTGNTTQIVIDVVELLSPASAQKDIARTRLRKMTPPLAGFAIGAVLGALAFAALSFWCVTPPVVILLVLAALQR
ncbi:DUF1275 domain-containing protein [Ralstonia syzygii]|uniref:DUF1275 domain-containing protein n=1 Tax=Ralstonia syzygii TaxID=28097 RepID=A0ABX7ZI85_9RALS|nr:YoaK family protein [Ralstonia syzygii]QUP55162.1 DUF1275 domain-containing protein [Ralstonia syzygii]